MGNILTPLQDAGALVSGMKLSAHRLRHSSVATGGVSSNIHQPGLRRRSGRQNYTSAKASTFNAGGVFSAPTASGIQYTLRGELTQGLAQSIILG